VVLAKGTVSAPTAASGAAVVQIGAFSSPALADKGWGDVSAAMAGQMAGKSKRVEALEKDGSTLYRTSVTGFSGRAAAVSFCEGLKAKGKICFVKG
jgi:cell division protein FtsN